MLVYILGVAALLVAGLVAFIASRPAEFRVTRSQTMIARPEQVFVEVNDLYRWNAWSPWARMDPDAKTTFEGATSGTGMKMHWDGNNQIGKGSMIITESRPSEFIRMTLDFLKPMKGTSTVEFTFTAQGAQQTLVTWTMYGPSNFIGKAMSLVIDCNKMVGGQYEQGLNNLKKIVEAK